MIQIKVACLNDGQTHSRYLAPDSGFDLNYIMVDVSMIAMESLPTPYFMPVLFKHLENLHRKILIQIFSKVFISILLISV